MLLMLSGINSFKTIKEVIRGYTGDRKAKQIYSEFDKIEVLKLLKFSGNSFKKVFGDGYLRPFELATFRLNNMNEIIQNWGDYIINVVIETSSAFFVFKVFINWGRNAAVVKIAAKYPNISIFIKIFKNYSLIKSVKNPRGSLMFDEYPSTSFEKNL